MPSPDYDIAIIGGGIVGLATALALRERSPEIRLVVLEKESHLGIHQTARNSMVMHSGVYYRPGSLKARFCREGRKLLFTFCESQGIRWKPCSKVIVATCEVQLPQLNELYAWGRANGVPELELIGSERLKELEPYVRGIQALSIPHAGAVDFVEVTSRIAHLLSEQLVEVLTEAHVMRVECTHGMFRLKTGRGEFCARYVVNCGGLQADRIARMVGVQLPFQLIPFRILRFLLKPERRYLVRSIVYPIPDPGAPQFGVHATRRFDGEVELGPGIALAFAREGYRATTIRFDEVFEMLRYPGFWNMLVKKRRVALAEIRRASSLVSMVRDLQRILPELTIQDIVREPAVDGILAPAFSRSGMMLEDFAVQEGPGSVHLLNAPSPAATAAFAIGRHLANIACTRGRVS